MTTNMGSKYFYMSCTIPFDLAFMLLCKRYLFVNMCEIRSVPGEEVAPPLCKFLNYMYHNKDV